MIQNYKTGFTLVELIVVITILAILGVIAFVSFNGFTETARNSVRLNAIAKITTLMDTSRTKGYTLLSFSHTGSEVLSAQLQGTGATTDNYRAGEFNEISLGIKEEDFVDPTSENKYLVGVTTKKLGHYQAAATLEESGIFTAKILGNYSPRNTTLIPGVGTSGNNKFTLSEYQYIGKLFSEDYVVGSNIPSGAYLTNISTDGTILTLSENFTGSVTSLQLATDEVEGLIIGIGGSSPVIDGGAEVPYSIGTSSSSTSGGGGSDCVFDSGSFDSCTIG